MLNLVHVISVFAGTAALGLILAAHVLRGKFAPWLLSLLHLLFGASGLALLLTLMFRQGGGPVVVAAFFCLVIAAFGGIVLAALFHGRAKLPPTLLVGLHAGLAVTGFALLLTQVL